MAEKKGKIIGKKYLDEMGEYVETHKKDAFTKLIFGIAIILLTLGYFKISRNLEMSMEIPPQINERGKITIGYDSANSLYYKVWGSYFIKEYTSLTPQNATKKLNHLLSMTQSDKAVLYRPKLEKKAQYIKSNRINQTYIPNEEKMLAAKQGDLYVFHSKGLLEERINRVTIKKHCEYNVGLKVVNYRLLVGLMNEKCKKIGSVR